MIARSRPEGNQRDLAEQYSAQQSPSLPFRGFCPNENPSGYYWEYLSAKVGDEEVWTKDEGMSVACVADPE